MTRAFKPYPAYRDSGSPWLGEVPAHWEVRRLNQVGKLSKGHGGSKEDETSVGVPCVRYGDLYTTHSYFIERTRSFVSEETSKNYTPIFFGDVLFAASGETIDEIGKSAANLMRTDACCGGDVILFRLESNAVARYMGYALDCRSSAAQKAAMGRGITVMHIYAGQLKRLLVLLPPIPEQVSIVRYLDHVCERIDHYIGAKERLIALLKERRQAIIDRAVTRGLYPNAPMKPTGIAWMPEVPAHWEVVALRHRYSQCLGKMLDSKRITGSHLLPYLRNTDIQWDRINVDNLPKMDIFPDEYDRYTVREGDLLICEGGEVGRCALWSGELIECGFQKALHRIRPRNADDDIPRFMYYVFCAAVNGNAFKDGHVSTIEHLTGDKLRPHRFPFPPVSEQTIVVAYLDQATAAIDTAIDRARRQIDLLREYRERLINDVVTGKLDVREARVATVPDADAPQESGQAPSHRAEAGAPAIP